MDDESPEQDEGGHPHPLGGSGWTSSLAVARSVPGQSGTQPARGQGWNLENGRHQRDSQHTRSRHARERCHYGAAIMYMHDFPPNFEAGFDRTRYCVSIDDAPCLPSQSTWRGAWTHTARSNHPGGVNSMAIDSSVRFVSDDVDALLWKQVATPNGGEILTSTF